MLKNALKQEVQRYFPNALLIWSAARRRRYFRKLLSARQRHHKLVFFGNCDPHVLSGPFAGLRYLDEPIWGPIEPKWLGTYEQELLPIIQQIIQTPYSTIIDIGSAEGYYAVGLAKLRPNANVYSYDVDLWARRQQRRLAQLNDVSNIGIKGVCTPDELAFRISGRCLLICDIEGYEYELLDPAKTESLRRCDILVETHEFEQTNMTIETGTEELSRRFCTSHEITVIGVQPRHLPDFNPALVAKLGPEGLAVCMDEMRSLGQLWMWLEAR
jgi:hypothetical protein